MSASCACRVDRDCCEIAWFQVDSLKARDHLGWKPVTTMDEKLKKTADAFMGSRKK